MAGYNPIFNYGDFDPRMSLGGMGYTPPSMVPPVPSVNSETPGGGGMFQGLSDIWNGSGFLSKQSMLGGTDERGVSTKGWAPVALGMGQAIMGGIQGQQAMKLAQSQFKEQKRQFDLNYGAQRTSMNTELEDRQRARVASNPGAYQSVSSYMDKNRIK